MSKKKETSPTPIADIKQPEGFTVVRDVGGFKISGTLADAPASRRIRERLAQIVDEFLAPYVSAKVTMDRHDLGMVCSSLTLKVRSYGVDFDRPFAIVSEQSAA